MIRKTYFVEGAEKSGNGIYLRTKSIYRYQDSLIEVDDKDSRGVKVKRISDIDGVFLLNAGNFLVVSDIKVSLEHGETGFVFPLHHAVRSGFHITSEVFSSGYEGHIGFNMSIHTKANIKVNSCIAEFVLL